MSELDYFAETGEFASTLATDRLQEEVKRELSQQIQEAKKSKRFRETEFFNERTTMIAFAMYQLLDVLEQYSVTDAEREYIIAKVNK